MATLRQKFRLIWPLSNERTRRLTAANEALQLGYGGVSMVRRACGLSRKAIAKGIDEIEEGDSSLAERIRRPGAGRKNLTVIDPALAGALDGMIAGATRGDPNLRYGGSARVRALWPPNCKPKGTR